MPQTSEERLVEALWEQNAGRWTNQVRSGADLFRDVFNNPLFLEFAGDLSGQSVLDIGCGEGTNTRLFARRGARMTGIDICPAFIDAARREEAERPLGIDYHVGSFTDLRCLDARAFDAAISTMAMMDGPDFRKAAHEIYRVLRTGGKFHFSVTHPCFVRRHSRWLTGPDNEVIGRVSGRYWDEEPFTEQWSFPGSPSGSEPFTIRYYPYRLEDYVNGLCDAGFTVCRMSEPRPTPEMVKALPALAPYRSQTPLFLYISARK